MMANVRLKILHLGKFYPPHKGGMESHLQIVCRALQKDFNVEVLVANENSKDEECWDGHIKIIRARTVGSISSAPICFGLPRKIRSAQADLVHVHWPNPPAVLALLVSGYRGPVVVTYHSDIVRQKAMGKAFEPFLHMLLKRSSAIVGTSRRYVESSHVLRYYADRCRVIPFGLPTDFSGSYYDQIAQIRENFGSRLVLSIGRLIYYKGFEYLIQAMKDVDGHLMIVGEGPLRQKLEMQVRVLRLSDKITFLGEIHNDEIAPYYHAADVFALASVARSEAFGIVQLEAMACGKPVVNTNLDSGVPWVSQHGVTGITVPPKDPIALAQAITKLLDDEDLRSRYGEAARLRVEKEFSQDLMIARMLETYREVLRGRVAHEGLSLTESPNPVKTSAPEVGASTSI